MTVPNTKTGSGCKPEPAKDLIRSCFKNFTLINVTDDRKDKGLNRSILFVYVRI